VESIDCRGDNELVAVCWNGSNRQTISPLDLLLGSPLPEGTEVDGSILPLATM